MFKKIVQKKKSLNFEALLLTNHIPEICGKSILSAFLLFGFISCGFSCVGLALRRCCFRYRLNSSKSFFKKSCNPLQSFCNCLQLVLGASSSWANSCKNLC